MASGKYERTLQHRANITKAKLASGYRHPDAVKAKIALSVKKTITRKKTGY